MEVVLGWFDLSGSGSDIVPIRSQDVPFIQQLLHDLVVVLGVVLSEAVAMTAQGGVFRGVVVGTEKGVAA